MNQVVASPEVIAVSPHQALAAILENRQPRSVLAISLNPIPMLEQWCDANGSTLRSLAERDPFPELADAARFDMAIIADQLEYMDHRAGEALLGRLRNLHTDTLVVLYQPRIAPQKLRWSIADFFGMGLRRQHSFSDGEREMALYTYELANYNFVRSWNNPRFWANPENWGKYWW